MAGEMNWVFVLEMGALGTLFLWFLGKRVLVRQNYQRRTHR
jgi:hypothetical protein